MSQREIIMGVLVDDNTTYTFVEVCQNCHLTEKVLLDMIEHGLFDNVTPPFQHLQFDQDMLTRVRTAQRLYCDLDLNYSGVILALELLDEMSKMRDELDILKRNVKF